MEEEKLLNDAAVEIIPGTLKAQVEKTVAEIKAANPKIKVVYPIVVEGEDYDGKEYYIGYFKQPDLKAFSKYLTSAQNNSVVSMRALAQDCFIQGDKELIEDESLFIFGLMGQMGNIIKVRNSALVNLSKPGK